MILHHTYFSKLHWFTHFVPHLVVSCTYFVLNLANLSSKFFSSHLYINWFAWSVYLKSVDVYKRQHTHKCKIVNMFLCVWSRLEWSSGNSLEVKFKAKRCHFPPNPAPCHQINNTTISQIGAVFTNPSLTTTRNPHLNRLK